ncbi:MAG: polysaccharide biosynthesis protein [Lachnospiraceae bacterium]|nr:polysaccharide biosynthesis protein [Lachnospiraceae bacterium]
MKFFKNRIIQGTILLTIAGFVTRILGFFYRIFLADRLGAQVLGSYQLIFPAFIICATIYGAGIQTAISQLTATHIGASGRDTNQTGKRILIPGIILSLILSIGLLLALQWFSVPIATYLLLAPECAPYLKILSVLFPFCGIGSCINGYYYGIQDAKVPAVTQIIEQLSRLTFVFAMLIAFPGTPEHNCRIAVWGMVIGEVVSALYTMGKYYHSTASSSLKIKHKKKEPSTENSYTTYLKPLLLLSITLTGTKLIIAMLHSAESIFIPASLRQFGCSPEEALSLYGVLSGMVMPFILFPSSITNAIALMLLPAVADSQSSGSTDKIKQYFFISTKYSLLLGFLCTGFFLVTGNFLGNTFFHNETSGQFLRLLSWLCPFLYLSTTLTSIINGLGKTKDTFIITCISQGIKLFCLVILVPRFGIMAYIHGTLASQIIMALLCFVPLKNYMHKASDKSLPAAKNECSVK